MEQGDLHANPIHHTNWPLIIHRDFKLGNVFWGLASEQKFRGYPMPKLGDFGLAAMIPKDDTRAADAFGRVGTALNRAPEQIQHVYPNEDEPRMLDSKTNVFGVGIVMWSLLEFEEGDQRLAWDPFRDSPENHDQIKDLNDTLLEPTFRGPVVRHYSQELQH